MKYPIFAFAVGVLLTEAVNMAALGKGEMAFAFGLGAAVITVAGACFEAVWNFKN